MTSSVRPEIRDSEDGEGFYDAHHLNLLHVIHEAKEQEKAGKDAGEGPRQILKAYMQEQGTSELYDDERGFKAFLQERSGTEWDVRNAPMDILQVARDLGLLKVDNAFFDQLRKAAPSTALDDLSRFRRQVTGSVALFVEKVK